MNTGPGMTQSVFTKKVFRGALLAAAIAACDSGAPTGEPKDDPTGNSDIVEALSQLPDATVLLYSADGVPQYIVGELGKIDPTQTDALIASDGRLRPALAPILKVFRLTNDDLVLRKVSTDEDGGRHFRYNQKFNGLEVVGGDLVVHVDVKGAISGINGTARGDISQSLGLTAVSLSAANSRIASDARFAGMNVTGSRMVYVQAQDGTISKAYEQVVEGKRGKDPVRDKVFVERRQRRDRRHPPADPPRAQPPHVQREQRHLAAGHAEADRDPGGDRRHRRRQGARQHPRRLRRVQAVLEPRLDRQRGHEPDQHGPLLDQLLQRVLEQHAR